MEKFITWTLVILFAPAIILCLGFVIIMPFAFIYEAYHPSQKIELSKNEWECGTTYEKRVFTGKIWHTITECSSYQLKEIK
jgi:hypothetical protein